MRLRIKTLAITAHILVAIILTVSFLGAVCDAHCLQPNSGHACCPNPRSVSEAMHSVAEPMTCGRYSELLSAVVIPVAMLVQVDGASVLVESRHQAGSESRRVLLSGSPPAFHLRI